MILQNIIGYELSSDSSKTIRAFDPKNIAPLGEEFVVATEAEVDKALQKAIQAWRMYRMMNDEHRAEFLNAIADGLENLEDELVQRAMLETGYSEARVLTERRRTISQIRMFADYIIHANWRNVVVDHAIPGRMPSPKPELRKMYMAIGPVVVFTASNFPLAYSTIGGDSISALAAGCPVIVKAHESHLGTNALVAEVIVNAAKETGMPDGVFSSLNGDGMETGKQLVLHPNTAAVGFTGSLKGGRALFDLGCQRPKPIPVFAEMGSVNPVFLFPEKVNKDRAEMVQKLVQSMTLTVGQFCTNPGILVAIKSDETASLVREVTKELEKIPHAVMLNKNIAQNFHRGVDKVSAESTVDIVKKGSALKGMYADPVFATVDAGRFIANPNLHEEVFGPFSLLVLCEDHDQMLEVARSLEGQLTSTIHADEEEHQQALKLLETLIEKAGRIIFNGVPTGVEVCEAMTHGGPYPASTDPRFTAVGHHAILRWLRPITFQDFPADLLPHPMHTIH